jgi:hypothetical protein
VVVAAVAKSKRTNWKSMTWKQAEDTLKTFQGPRATWQKLWSISRNRKRDSAWAKKMLPAGKSGSAAGKKSKGSGGGG